jgi:molybdenum cofactor cytidylyltransferase
MLAGTVKIIAYGVAGTALERACEVARGAMRVRPVVRSAGLMLSAVPGQPEKLNAKARRVMAGRLTPLGMDLAEVREVPHDRAAIAAALAEVRATWC